MNIGIDIDGVLFPWADVANEVVMERFGVPDPGPHVDWLHLEKVVDGATWKWLWSAEGQDAVFSQVGRTYPGVVAMVEAATRSPENHVHFVTHRDPRRAGLHTAHFLREHFASHPWAGIHVVQNSVAKRTLGRWDVFIDDKPETVFDLLANSGAMVFAPARPWNEEDLGDVEGSNFCRYDDPAQVAEWVVARS